MFAYRLYRQHCIETNIHSGGSSYLKDLRIIVNRDFHDLIIVDNAAMCFALQLENGVPILPFYSDKGDDELMHLVSYLKFISESNDVRVHNRKAFSLRSLGST